ncbi:DUF3047 domain-containing protein [Candidatus Manganitrophus noduliformans]|uniref:TVP38/TMEM64 family membrane protein n=1 Tax=Candidatus Manganitrophus noduliformans TaxID=2606439 RepID=A0A7X6DNZ7_9BACT|nr:DUF3047 domain-containing protein [Candidatus Manganitrophus noduliformans]NKE70722.1 DUF3047 domain-containing protein [Candidatus Manganitrophus noduliformans]
MASKRRFFLFLLLLIVLVAAVRLLGLHDALDQERLRSGIDRWGAWGPLLYILIFAIAPVLFLPGLPITVAGGLAFGPLWGTVYASIGSTLGAGLAFLVARYFAREAVSEMLGERWKRIDAGVAERGWVFVAITRLIPLFPFNLLNYAFGLTRIPFAIYLFTSWLFMLPGTAAYVIFSSSLLDLIKGDLSPAFLIGLLLLVALSVIPFFYRRWKGSKDSLPKVIIWGAALLLPFLAIQKADAEERIDLLTNRQGESGLPEGWRPLTFQRISRHTDYQLLEEDGRPVIRAVSRRSASGLIHPLDLDPRRYETLSWCWKVDRIISKGDETEKKGDDYAARVYVTFRFDPDKATFWERTKFSVLKRIYGEYPPKAAINYIWANRLPKGEAIANAYTDRARMVAVESGAERIGEWVCQARSLYADYRWLFDEEPPRLSGIAVMTDTDDTGEEATAFYSDISLKAK